MNEGNRVPPGEEPEGPAAPEPTGRPAGHRAQTTPGDSARTSGAMGSGPADSASADFELARPEAPEAVADADFELAGPSEVEEAGAEQGGAEQGGAEEGRAEESTARPADVPAESVLGENAWAAPTERPRPLHAPDPYGTPPYGEPGPWAPAPPVQHPAARPTPAPTAPGTQAPSATPPTPNAPTPGASAPVPLVSHPEAPAPAPGTGALSLGMTPPAPVPGTEAPAPGPAPHGPTPPAPAVPALGAPAPGGLGGVDDDPWGRYDPWAPGSPQEQAARRGVLQYGGAGRGRRRLVVGWTAVVALVAAGVGGIVGAYAERQGLDGEVRLPQAGRVPAGRAPDSVAGIAARALPSVVTLHVSGTDQTDTGTGFVLDTQGHILTNNHVVAPAGSSGAISVTFSSGDSVQAKVVGRDSGYDLAVVQVHGVHGLTPLPLGDSDGVRVGDPVVAIGAPYDLANTVTSGIISAKERPITAGGEKGDGSDVSYVDALQTDAPINPGNSGGPLLDSEARVIGINSAIRSADSGSDSGGGQSGSIGLGFAIPVNQAKRVAEELINHGRATHPVLGVTLDMAYSGDGARIDSKSASGGPAVTPGGPGDRAGLKAGDVVGEVDGQPVHSARELIVRIRAHRPGDRLRLTVRRDGTDREVPLVLGAAEQN
ncbi:trypsin-like peptidase domain-containing protein [Streptomyces monashensis]|uniref:trypsin-like peptidase domain-containing protein n=1 Tax=Streptomyces monashensis TaxID=1678012 RepID=UPI000AD11344|nr:trypsin-like peptidase domain-containing protein [Streptomyces monashensis]